MVKTLKLEIICYTINVIVGLKSALKSSFTNISVLTFLCVLKRWASRVLMDRSLDCWLKKMHNVRGATKFYLGQNEDWGPGYSTSNSSNKRLQKGGKVSIYVILVEREYMKLSTCLSRRFLLVSWSLLLVMSNSHQSEAF